MNLKVLGWVCATAWVIPTPVVAQDSPGENPAVQAQVAATCGRISVAVFQAMPPERRADYLNCYAREFVNSFQPTLPRQVDSVTTLTAMTASGALVSYHHTIDVSKSQIAPQAMEAFKETIRQQVCRNPAMSPTIALGLSYRYVWVDRDRVPLGEITIRKC